MQWTARREDFGRWVQHISEKKEIWRWQQSRKVKRTGTGKISETIQEVLIVRQHRKKGQDCNKSNNGAILERATVFKIVIEGDESTSAEKRIP